MGRERLPDAVLQTGRNEAKSDQTAHELGLFYSLLSFSKPSEVVCAETHRQRGAFSKSGNCAPQLTTRSVGFLWNRPYVCEAGKGLGHRVKGELCLKGIYR